jgi:hypothetical protein
MDNLAQTIVYGGYTEPELERLTENAKNILLERIIKKLDNLKADLNSPEARRGEPVHNILGHSVKRYEKGTS